MANRYQSDDRSRRYGRGYGGYEPQEEQFDTGASYEGERSYGQMGDSWRDYGQQETGWQPDDRYLRERERGFGEDYRSGIGGRYSRFPGEPLRNYDRYTGSDFQSRSRARGDYAADRARETFATGAGTRLASAHGEWHDPDDYGTRSASWDRHYRERNDGRNFFERAGDEIAGWFGNDTDGYRRERGYRGHGPANYTRSDERIREDANDRLTDDWRVDARNITVTVQNGEITLDGTVPSREQKRRAEDCVEDVSGVKHVQNNLRVQERTGWDRDDTYDPARSEGNTTTGNL
jgi:osmotically-inducible protein OsmY